MSCLRVDIKPADSGFRSSVSIVNDLTATCLVRRNTEKVNMTVIQSNDFIAWARLVDPGLCVSVCNRNSSIKAVVNIVCYTNVSEGDYAFLTVTDGFLITIDGEYIRVLDA